MRCRNAGTHSTNANVRVGSATVESDCMRSITRLACRPKLKNPEELPSCEHEMQRHDARNDRGHIPVIGMCLTKEATRLAYSCVKFPKRLGPFSFTCGILVPSVTTPRRGSCVEQDERA